MKNNKSEWKRKSEELYKKSYCSWDDGDLELAKLLADLALVYENHSKRIE